MSIDLTELKHLAATARDDERGMQDMLVSDAELNLYNALQPEVVVALLNVVDVVAHRYLQDPQVHSALEHLRQELSQ